MVRYRPASEDESMYLSGVASVGETRIQGSEDERTHAPPAPTPSTSGLLLESAHFFDSADAQIYTVTHTAVGPRRGSVLLCGPFGVERERAYLTIVRWARLLAARGFEVMRFDYRGQGESSGTFEDMTLLRWTEDAAHCAALHSAATRGEPLVVQGIRLGALIAAELFASGVGDGLLMWEPPASAEALLRDTLRHNLIEQRKADPTAPPRMREQLIAALESGEQVNVDGYFWTREWWREARLHPLLLPPASEARPWNSLEARSVDADTFWGSSSPLLVPRSDGFFRASLRWLDENEPWRARNG